MGRKSKIKINTSQYKIWKKKQNIRNLKRRARRDKRKNKKNKIKNLGYKQRETYISFDVPSIFSIKDNPEEVIKFYNDMLKKIEQIPSKSNKKYTLGINMKEVTKITGDALIYLLTIIKDAKINFKGGLNWIGNFPENDEIKSYLKKSGFLKYLRTNKNNILHSNDTFEIQSAKNMNGIIGKQICDFVDEKLSKNLIYSKFLYRMLTELMTNTKDHAYNETSRFEYYWYIFVEAKEETIQFTFMDNGLGIPTTINKKFKDKIQMLFNSNIQHKYIESALNGEFRTETKEEHRGTGLPDIKKISDKKQINNLTIISNKAYYSSINKGKDLNNNFEGTLFYWEINRKDIK